MKFPWKALLPVVLLLLLGGVFCLWLLGSRNPYTPAGYVGYLTQGAVFGKARFIGLQTGPTSSGRVWLYDVINISITPYTYTEDFTGDMSVLSRDNLQVSFRVHVVWRVQPENVKDFVEKYSTIQPGDPSDKIIQTAYNYYLKEPLRTFARVEVQKHNGLEIKDKIPEIDEAILQEIHKIANGTPFAIRSVVIGNIQYPEEVAQAVAKKLAATQELERKQTEIDITRREKEKRIVEAEGVARAMEIINERLTSSYLQYEAIKAQREMINSPNHTTIYIPVGPMGVPLVNTINSPSERK